MDEIYCEGSCEFCRRAACYGLALGFYFVALAIGSDAAIAERPSPAPPQPSRRRGRACAMAVSVGVLLAACSPRGSFVCQSSSACNTAPGGVCEVEVGACAYPAATCPSGLAYSAEAPNGLAGICVAAPADQAIPDASLPDRVPVDYGLGAAWFDGPPLEAGAMCLLAGAPCSYDTRKRCCLGCDTTLGECACAPSGTRTELPPNCCSGWWTTNCSGICK